MAPEGDLKKRVGRKLTKKRKDSHQATMEIPERFQDGDDADEDCTAMHGANAYMNQSVFGMIAAAGSQVDFNARFDGQSSDDEEDSGEPSAQSSGLHVNKTRKSSPAPKSAKPEKHRRKFSESKLLRSLPRLGSRTRSKHSPTGNITPNLGSNPEPTTPEIQVSHTSARHPPVMGRMLEARAELSMRPSFDMPRNSKDNLEDGLGGDHPSSLAKRLMEIFEFEKAEDVIEGMVRKCFRKYRDVNLIQNTHAGC